MKITFHWDSAPAVSDMAQDIEQTICTQLMLAAAKHGITAKELLVLLSAAPPFSSLRALVVNQDCDCLFDVTYPLRDPATATYRPILQQRTPISRLSLSL